MFIASTFMNIYITHTLKIHIFFTNLEQNYYLHVHVELFFVQLTFNHKPFLTAATEITQF